MAIDTRWNNFGCDDLIDFLRSDFDKEIRRNTTGCVMGIEKLMSGMYIGEVVRQVLFRMHSKNIILASWPESWLDVYSLQTETISEFLKVKETEDDNKFLESHGISISAKEFKITKLVCQLVVLRAAHLTAACTACLVNRVGRSLVGIAVDGSIYKHIQMFRDILEEKISHLLKPGVQCYFVPCEDGSGVGAALIAAMVSENNKIN